MQPNSSRTFGAIPRLQITTLRMINPKQGLARDALQRLGRRFALALRQRFLGQLIPYIPQRVFGPLHLQHAALPQCSLRSVSQQEPRYYAT